jgi:hypothetical protein
VAISSIAGIGQFQGSSHLSGVLAVGGAPAASRATEITKDIPSAANLSAAAQPVYNQLLKLNTGPGPVSFKVSPLKAPVPVLTSTPSLPPSSKPEYILPSSPGLLGRITATVAQIAVSAVYPAPIFSFSV